MSLGYSCKLLDLIVARVREGLGKLTRGNTTLSPRDPQPPAVARFIGLYYSLRLLG